ncbi:hypothetical protein Ciccas_003090 [Cichlidogyrus casuarinus]|uniref:Uncharacterized protein n=1 Tax=Cichlidogyrus casuarinus TaxID=1844966 RepID=A0ABD2QFD1_9PLAT
MHCQYKCDEKDQKNCKRMCTQKPCKRPEYHIVYDYEYSRGLCRRTGICVYKGVCQGKDHKWINYSKLRCKTLIDNPYMPEESYESVRYQPRNSRYYRGGEFAY